MDQGIQSFRMMLVPHNGTWKESNIVRISEEFISPLVSIYQGIHPGSLPKSNSFIAIDKQNIIVSAVKQSEEGEDIIIRCVEMFGISASAKLDLHFMGKNWAGNFRPYEIKSFRVNQKMGEIKEVNLLEE